MSKTHSKTARIGARARKLKLPDGVGELVVRDADIAGFVLRIRPNSKRYAISGRIANTGQRRTITIGDAFTISATEARERAMEIRHMFRSGIDPEAKPDAATLTLNQMADEYLGLWSQGKLERQKKPPRPTSVASHNLSIRRALEQFGTRQVADISTGDIRVFLSKLRRETVSPSTKQKAFGSLSSVLQFAFREGHIEMNPCRMFEAPAGSEARERL